MGTSITRTAWEHILDESFAINVHLTPELERIVQHQVQSGRYGSASEVMAEALHLLEERDEFLTPRKDEIRKKVAAGCDSLRRGEGIDGEEFFGRLEQKEPSRREA